MNKNFLIGIAAVAAAGYYFLKGKKQVTLGSEERLDLNGVPALLVQACCAP